MDLDTGTGEGPGWLARSLAWAVGVVCAHPWVTLGLTLLSCAVSGFFTWNNLSYLTHRNDLISSKKDYLKRWHQYLDEFGDDDDMIVVVQGNERKAMEEVLEEISGEIRKKPDSFERLFYKVDLRPLHSRALLFLPTDQVRQVQAHIQGMSLLLEPPVLGTLDPWFGWRSLSVQQLLRESERRLSAWKPDQPNVEAQKFFKQLAPICVAAGDYLESPGQYRNPWRSALPDASLSSGSVSSQEDQIARPQYFFSADGKLAFLMVSPVKEKQGEDFNYSQRSITVLREIVARVQGNHGNVEIGLTGLPVLENDEMIASRDDSNFAAWLALIGVALLYLVVYRGVRYPFMTVAGLMVGTVWALGWLTLTVGHLNILSSAFAVMLIGMGDYGVLWVTRFGQERQAGLDIAQANRQTAIHVGPSILTAAVTTAASFFAAMLADLKAVSELGWIAGCGVLLCAVSCFLVVPALLAILDFRVVPVQPKGGMILSMQEHREANREWLSWLMWKPRWVLAFSGVATLVLFGFALDIDYDHNLLNMQAPGLESVKWEKKLIEHMTGSSWYAVSWTTTPEEALALKAKYEKLPEVSQVITVASMIPTDQDRKLEILRDLQQRLRNLPERGKVLKHAPSNLDDITQTGSRVLRTLTRLQSEKPNDSLAELQAGVTKLVATVRKQQRLESEVPTPSKMIVQASHSAPIGSVRQHLQQFDEYMTRDLAEDLHRLRDVSTPTPIQLEDLPACLRERFVGKNGKWLVRIFSKDCLWNFEPLARFIQQVRTVDPEATGKPFTTLEGLKAMQSGFLWAGFYALIAMVLVLLLDFGRLKHTVVALLPLAMGMTAALGFMALFHVPLNPANMIAFPLILGVGADNGVHVLHDFRSRDRTKRYRLSHATGRGIMVAALTTILGFGTLMLATHRGMASLGLILTLGVTCCMATALVFLPALLYVLGRREKLDGVTATLPMQVRDAA